MDLQNKINEMLEGLRVERSKTQLTLGKLTTILENSPETDMVDDLTTPHSYRGYYSDLAFGNIDSENRCTVKELLVKCKELNGLTFTGYKGGEFTMGDDTPLWVANYGSGLGERIMGLDVNGHFDTVPEEDL